MTIFTSRPTYKLKMRSTFPASIEAINPILVSKSGGRYTFDFDPTYAPTGPQGEAGPGYGGTSTTSLLIANAVNKVFATQAGLAYQPGSYIRASSAANGANFMEGTIASYTGTTLTLSVTNISGSGTHADWTFSVAGIPGDSNIVQQQTNSHTSYDTNKVNRFNNRVFIADATVNTADPGFPYTRADWLGQLNTISIGGGDGVGLSGSSDLDYATLGVLTDNTTENAVGGGPVIGILSAVQSLNNAQPRAIEAFAINNPSGGAFPNPAAWAHYIEAHRLNAAAADTFAIEAQCRNSGDLQHGTPYNLPTGATIGLLLGAGCGLSATGQFDCTTAIAIGANPMKWTSGITFAPGGIGAYGPGSSISAIQMPRQYAIQWFAGGTSLGASIYTDGSDDLVLSCVSGSIVTDQNISQTNGKVYGWGDLSTYIGGDASTDVITFNTAGAESARIDGSKNFVVNTAVIATSATNGFLYVPSCAGTPTGVPTTYAGRVPIVVNTTNNKLYFYSSGAWRDAGP